MKRIVPMVLGVVFLAMVGLTAVGQDEVLVTDTTSVVSAAPTDKVVYWDQIVNQEVCWSEEHNTWVCLPQFRVSILNMTGSPIEVNTRWIYKERYWGSTWLQGGDYWASSPSAFATLRSQEVVWTIGFQPRYEWCTYPGFVSTICFSQPDAWSTETMESDLRCVPDICVELDSRPRYAPNISGGLGVNNKLILFLGSVHKEIEERNEENDD